MYWKRFKLIQRNVHNSVLILSHKISKEDEYEKKKKKKKSGGTDEEESQVAIKTSEHNKLNNTRAEIQY